MTIRPSFRYRVTDIHIEEAADLFIKSFVEEGEGYHAKVRICFRRSAYEA